MLGDSPDFYSDVYIKPYGRCVPYLMGLLLGVLYMEFKGIFTIIKSKHELINKLK